MKKLLLLMNLFPLFTTAQTFWTETFDNGCTATNCLASAYSGTNGSWTVASTGTNANAANEWYVSCQENGECLTWCGLIGCSASICGNGQNATLHIGRPSSYGGGTRAGYYDGEFCPTSCGTTNKRVESPVINCAGRTNIRANLLFLGYGDNCGSDKASFVYSADGGTTWTTLKNCFKVNCCGNVPCTGTTMGSWDSAWITLPSSATDNPNVKVGFVWTNNDDGTNNEVSFAANDLKLSGPSIVANFSASATTICMGDSVIFTDLSTGPPASWSWSFTPNTVTYTGGTSSTSKNPEVIFDSVGTYTVSLTAGGDNETKAALITVHPNASADAGPDRSICRLDSVMLAGSGSGSFSWSPSTGLSADSVANPIASPAASTTYTLTVTDTTGCSATDQVAVNVNPVPDADFIADKTTPVENQDTVNFSNLSSNADSYNWDFGDNATSSVADPSHLYDSAASYSVSLAAMTDSGCTDTLVKINYINVQEGTGAGMEVSGDACFLIRPNPSAFETALYYRLPASSAVVISVRGIHGQEEVELINQEQGRGDYSIRINTSQLSPGIYFATLKIDGRMLVRKLVVLE